MAAAPSLPQTDDTSEASPATCCGQGCGVRVVGYLPGGRVPGLDCDQPLLVVRGCGVRETWACNNHRESKCVPCSWKYRRRLERVAEAGTYGTGFLYLLTLTAPGDRQHTMPSGDVCACTPVGGVDLAEWNASAAGRWNLLRTRLRKDIPTLQYLRAVEVQKRGALHLHVIVRSPAPLDPVELRHLAVGYGFGHSVDLEPLPPGSRRAARYVSKYVTKGSDARLSVPWASDHVDRLSGEITRVRYQPATFRTWSASQGWGLTMREVREAIRRVRETSVQRAAASGPREDRLRAPGAAPPAVCAESPPP